ncbi:MAG TPA: 16S rRNA (guanine(527)-N(7))-methyltransferase RsmG [Polyangia bacterium]|jgi:16S rRNA (guanine527-N7)-methyltransferase
MDAALTRRLREGADAVGVPLEPGALPAFGAYLDLLLTWNRRINLTSVTAPAAVVDRHFVDCLALAPLLPHRTTLLDVGSGAGFPGVVVALARPDLRVTLCESRAKRVAFLLALVNRLKVRAEVLQVRSEELVDPGERTFDSVVSRAVLPLEDWAVHGPELVGPGGQLCAMVSSVPEVAPGIDGFTAADAVRYALPGGAQHAILRWRRLASQSLVR